MGRTGLYVSEIALGTVKLGMRYGIPMDEADAPPDEFAAASLLNDALDAGVNMIDTARTYGKSEGVIGRALKTRRSEFILASKVVSGYGENLTSAEIQERVRKSVYASLYELQTDVVDLMQIHCSPQENNVSESVIEELLRLRRGGSIRFIGASVYGDEAALQAIRGGVCDCVQVPYSVLDRSPESAVLPAAQKKGIGILIRSVLLKGALTPRYTFLPDEMAPLKSAVQRIERQFVKRGCDLVEGAYRYVLDHPAISSALVGASNITELRQAIAVADAEPLPATLRESLQQINIAERRWLNPGLWPDF